MAVKFGLLRFTTLPNVILHFLYRVFLFLDSGFQSLEFTELGPENRHLPAQPLHPADNNSLLRDHFAESADSGSHDRRDLSQHHSDAPSVKTLRGHSDTVLGLHRDAAL